MEDLQHISSASLKTNQDDFQKSTKLFSMRIQMMQKSSVEQSLTLNVHPFKTFSMHEQQVDLHLVGPKSFGLQEKRKIQILKGLKLAQQEELSETTHAATVFPVLCFLCPAAVPLLSMSQISNDRHVCAGCTKRACLWQLFLRLKLWMMGGLLGGGRQRCLLHTAHELAQCNITQRYWNITGSHSKMKS